MKWLIVNWVWLSISVLFVFMQLWLMAQKNVRIISIKEINNNRRRS